MPTAIHSILTLVPVFFFMVDGSAQRIMVGIKWGHGRRFHLTVANSVATASSTNLMLVLLKRLFIPIIVANVDNIQ